MSEEEKELKSAIKELKSIANGGVPPELAIVEAKALLNLIEKQQKELENLNEINQLVCNKILITQDDVQDNFIAKDKIREKIKELEEQMHQDEVDEFGIHSIGWGTLDYVVEQFKELLEEK